MEHPWSLVAHRVGDWPPQMNEDHRCRIAYGQAAVIGESELRCLPEFVGCAVRDSDSDQTKKTPTTEYTEHTEGSVGFRRCSRRTHSPLTFRRPNNLDASENPRPVTERPPPCVCCPLPSPWSRRGHHPPAARSREPPTPLGSPAKTDNRKPTTASALVPSPPTC